ncbi:hypothetical protein [Winogradskyella sp. MH6]|uniref:hypothetical protein n=1 Tax=Winogradskyella sp. MH6 TaxID=2929510 RepID=UPI001FB27216|nr:hypothetical protein [Winogradskyella sp. MH6]
MRRILFLIAIVLISSCKTENKNEENQTTKPQEPVSEIPKVKGQFQMFLDQFPTKRLPVKIYGCSDEILGLPKLDIKLSAKYSKEAEYEHIYGIIPSNGNYISTITLGEAECFVPTLNTYKLNGEKIDSKPIFIGYCGSDPCYECVESMTINSDYRFYVADTIKTSDCDGNFKAIAGTEKIKVVYKEGKLTEKGIIELTEEIEKEVENVITENKQNCDLRTLVEINSFLENGIELNDQNFAVFFANMKPSCLNNVEYSEFNNDLIFKTLKSNPKKFVAFLSRVSKKKEILDFVLTQLRNPIHDGIKLDSISLQLDQTETEDSQMKELVSESIKQAIEKSKLHMPTP